jgi:hypothetical protein
MSKNRSDAGTFDIPIQRAIFGRRLFCQIFLGREPRATGSLREWRFLDNRYSWPVKSGGCEARCAGSSGHFLPPSPPAEKASSESRKTKIALNYH